MRRAKELVICMETANRYLSINHCKIVVAADHIPTSLRSARASSDVSDTVIVLHVGPSWPHKAIHALCTPHSTQRSTYSRPAWNYTGEEGISASSTWLHLISAIDMSSANFCPVPRCHYTSCHNRCAVISVLVTVFVLKTWALKKDRPALHNDNKPFDSGMCTSLCGCKTRGFLIR